jgi:hypothetical protein
MNDAMRQLKKAIDAKRAELPALEANFQAVREKLDGQPIEVIGDPNSEQMKAAEDAHRPLLDAQNDLSKLDKPPSSGTRSWRATAPPRSRRTPARREALDRAEGPVPLRSAGRGRSPATRTRTLRRVRRAAAAPRRGSVGRDPARADDARGGDPVAPRRRRSAGGAAHRPDASGAALLTQQVDSTITPLPYVRARDLRPDHARHDRRESIRYVRQVSRTLNAREVPEAITTADIGSGVPAVTEAEAASSPSPG